MCHLNISGFKEQRPNTVRPFSHLRVTLAEETVQDNHSAEVSHYCRERKTCERMNIKEVKKVELEERFVLSHCRIVSKKMGGWGVEQSMRWRKREK